MTIRLVTQPLPNQSGIGFYSVLEGAPPWTLTASLTNHALLFVNGIKATVGAEFVVDGAVISWVGAYEIDDDLVEVYG